MNFSNVFNDLLNRSGLTQAEFCRLSGLSTSYVSQLKTGKIPDPSFNKVCLIADTLQVSIDDINQMWLESHEIAAKNIERMANDNEMELLSAYRLLSDSNKSVIYTIARALMLLEQ